VGDHSSKSGEQDGKAIYNGKVKNGLSSLECTQVLEIRDQRRSGNASIADCEHMFMILR
jgi:hypothetical protein